MSFPSPTWGLVGPFLPASGNQASALPFLSRAPPPACRVGPGVGLVVPSLYHTPALYISGSQEESGVAFLLWVVASPLT